MDGLHTYCQEFTTRHVQTYELGRDDIDGLSGQLAEWAILSRGAFSDRARDEFIMVQQAKGNSRRKQFSDIMHSFARSVRTLDIDDTEWVSQLAQEILNAGGGYHDLASEAWLRSIQAPELSVLWSDVGGEQEVHGTADTRGPTALEYQRLIAEIATAMHRDRWLAPPFPFSILSDERLVQERMIRLIRSAMQSKQEGEMNAMDPMGVLIERALARGLINVPHVAEGSKDIGQHLQQVIVRVRDTFEWSVWGSQECLLSPVTTLMMLALAWMENGSTMMRALR